jgi:hypothetical protein
MVIAEAFLETVVAWARIDCIEEQTGVEPILPVGIELAVMAADTDNSNCPW